MEIVALNERLRGDFSALLKLLPPPYAVSAYSTSKSSISPAKFPDPASSDDDYTQHCRLLLWRLNSYQYGSASAFLLDLEQLERVAESLELKQEVQNLLGRIAVSEGEKQDHGSLVKVSNTAGATVSLGLSSSVPGLQEVTSNGSDEAETATNTTWLCNVSLGGQIMTIGTYKGREEALQGYEEQRKKMADDAASFNKLMQLADKVEGEQRDEDKRVLEEAMAQCHPRLTTMKVSTVVPPVPAASCTGMSARAIPRTVTKSLATAASSPAASPAPSEAGTSPPRASRASKRQKAEDASALTSAAKKQKVESSSNSAASSSSVGNRSYLKLRRLVQKRLCKHLKGQKVCVLPSPDKRDETRWIASGRLEAGKVYSLHKKKQMTFADYVRDELGRAVSACEHMFLVRTKESIDDHLKLCDAFSNKERELDPPTKLDPMRNRKTSRRR